MNDHRTARSPICASIGRTPSLVALGGAYLPGRQPVSALGAKLLHRQRLVLSDLLRRHGVLPPPVGALVDESTRTPVPKRASQRRTRRRVFLHPVESALFDRLVPFLLLDGDLQESGNLAHRAGKVALEVVKVQKHHVGLVAHAPPCLDIVPERPKGLPILADPDYTNGQQRQSVYSAQYTRPVTSHPLAAEPMHDD